MDNTLTRPAPKTDAEYEAEFYELMAEIKQYEAAFDKLQAEIVVMQEAAERKAAGGDAQQIEIDRMMKKLFSSTQTSLPDQEGRIADLEKEIAELRKRVEALEGRE